MKGIFLKKFGEVDLAFEVKETPSPKPEPHQVKIKVEAFGLNFADVLARKGLYGDAPPLPCILGYECVGTIAEVGQAITKFNEGDRVLAFTRFGSYAQFAVTDSRAVVKIDNDIKSDVALALGTQYCTAYYAAYECLSLHAGDVVLIHAAAGGVGVALTQLAKEKGCTVIGTVGSNEKFDFIKANGVDHPINYRTTNFEEEVRKILGKRRVDAIFDAVGGKTFKQGMKVLNYGGSNVIYGAASRTNGGLMANLKLLFGFGFYTPIKFLMKSQNVIGVNMLRIADYKPEIIQLCLEKVYELYQLEIVKPHVGKVFKANEIASAHALLESRNSRGKIAVEW
jgi:NADPH:quinone reductase-like Zn-dependent oxidoreductase